MFQKNEIGNQHIPPFLQCKSADSAIFDIISGTYLRLYAMSGIFPYKK